MLQYLKANIKFFYKHYYLITVLFILIVASILRTYNFTHHFGLSSDSSRDIAIAKVSIEKHDLPLMGSYSSAGPFIFGPIFYWVLIVSYLILPFTLWSPLIFFVLIGILNVNLIILIGKIIKNNKLAITCGLLAATSPQLISGSTELNQQTLVGFFTTAAVLFLVLFWKKKKFSFVFFSGIFIGTAISTHYQAINLLILILTIPFLIVGRVKKISAIFIMTLGVIIPLTSLMIWDSQQDWANLRNLLDYLLIGQYRIYVPNSWKLFLFNYLPHHWSHVAGGWSILAFVLILLVFLMNIIRFFWGKTDRINLVLLMTFAIMIIINRYYRGERLEGYMLYLSPFVILLSSWSIVHLIEFNKRFKHASYAVLLFIIIGNLYLAKDHIFSGTNKYQDVKNAINKLQQKYPISNFTLYESGLNISHASYTLSVILDDEKLLIQNVKPIGICQCDLEKSLAITIFDFDIVDLSNKNLKDPREEWRRILPEDIYEPNVGWLSKGNLKSNFSLVKFIQGD